MKNKKLFSQGQAVITTVLFFLLAATTIGVGVINPVVRQVKQSSDLALTRENFYVANSANEDMLYRLITNKQFISPSTLSLNGHTAQTVISVVSGGLQLDTTGSGFEFERKVRTHLTTGNGASFNYGVQTGTGGVILENSSSIVGNLYSNGTVSGSGNLIKGDVVSAGPTGLIDDIHATSSAYAHTITDSTIDKNAYYHSISGTTVDGVSYPGSADQATSTFPISDDLIASMEAAAASGGAINSPCPYNISSNATIGPVVINCDLNISGGTITLAGPVWVKGNIDITNSAVIRLSSSVGNQSVAMIADNPTDRLNSSTIELRNSASFQGSGTAGTFVAMISQNRSSESGGTIKAIRAENNIGGSLLAYAAHGEISLENSISLKEVTAYKLRLRNSAQVTYDTGLTSLLFSSGPSGGYVFDNWREVQ